jgi:hypothetical protein
MFLYNWFASVQNVTGELQKLIFLEEKTIHVNNFGEIWPVSNSPKVTSLVSREKF